MENIFEIFLWLLLYASSFHLVAAAKHITKFHKSSGAVSNSLTPHDNYNVAKFSTSVCVHGKTTYIEKKKKSQRAAKDSNHPIVIGFQFCSDAYRYMCLRQHHDNVLQDVWWEEITVGYLIKCLFNFIQIYSRTYTIFFCITKKERRKWRKPRFNEK